MTTLELIKEKNNKISELKEEISKLKELRILECNFKIGEKVKVFKIQYSWKKEKELIFEGEGFIGRIYVKDNGDFNYILSKVKKDGTSSRNNFPNFYEYKVEKL